MKQLSRILALLLAVMMLASIMAACGDDSKKSDSKSDDSSQAEAVTAAPAADILTGSWKQTDEMNGDWVWTFDGRGNCHLTGITTGFEGNGEYTLDESTETVKVKIDAWDTEKDYMYTLNGDTLDLNSAYSNYHLIKE